MRDFFAELKRRHVYRIAVFYAAAAWLLIQIADIILENFNQPENIMQVLIFCAALGFPVALVLAWIFDARTGGTRHTTSVDQTVDQRAPASAASTSKSASERPGIVVLPFEYFSDEPLDEVVSNGFTEDLTTLLAQLAGFFVISRSTAYTYKGQMKDLREIGAELGVRYLLEGSMRRMGDKVRVTAQLIEADTGSHLWAEHYDTPTDELASVQDALIEGIALRLDVELARAEFKLASRKRPSDMDAWSLYQSAKGTLMFMGWNERSVKQASEQLRESIKLDPFYAAPQAYLALLLALAHWLKLLDDLPSAQEESLAKAEQALELDPGSSEVLGFVGCALSDLGFRSRGVPLLEKAIELDASNAQARAALGAAQIVAGDLDQGIATLSEAIKISPKDPGLALWATILCLGTGYSGDIEQAERWVDLAFKSDPSFFPALILRAWILGLRGKREAAQACLDEAAKLYPPLSSRYIGGFVGKDVVNQMQQAGISLPGG